MHAGADLQIILDSFAHASFAVDCETGALIGHSRAEGFLGETLRVPALVIAEDGTRVEGAQLPWRAAPKSAETSAPLRFWRDGRLYSILARRRSWFDTAIVMVSIVDVAEDIYLAETDAGAVLGRIAASIDEYLYSGELLDQAAFRETFVGPGVDRLLGGAPQRHHGWDTWVMSVHEEDVTRASESDESLRLGKATAVEHRLIGLDGKTRWVRDRCRPWRDAQGRMMADGIATDITEEKRLEALLIAARTEAERLSRTDELTGVANRRHFSELLSAQLESAEPFGILLIDIDHFKVINDTHGHAAGDHVLATVASRLRVSTGLTSETARWGGEEFAVLVRGVTSSVALRTIAETFRSEAGHTVPYASASISVTVSIGATLAARESTPESLFADADTALYRAKREGRNRVEFERTLAA